MFEICISFAFVLLLSSSRRMIDLDSFLDGDNGIDGVLELSTKISFILTLETFEISPLISSRRFFHIAPPVRANSNTDLNKLRF